MAEVFVRLFEEGLIYRDERLVNWDPIAQTVLSDLEIDNEPENGHLWQIRYKVCDSVIDTSSANTSNYRFAVERSPS